MSEHVVYRYDPNYDPAIQYHSTPSLCFGGANTLDEARSTHRSQLAGRLGLDRHELPSVIEHIEAIVAGRWVRTQVGAVHRDATGDRMFLQTLMSSGQAQDRLRAHLQSATNGCLEPVIVIVEPDDTVGAVFDQMTPDDALLVTHFDTQDVVRWIAIYGPAASAADIPQSIDDAALRELPIATVTQMYATASEPAMRVRGCAIHTPGA